MKSFSTFVTEGEHHDRIDEFARIVKVYALQEKYIQGRFSAREAEYVRKYIEGAAETSVVNPGEDTPDGRGKMYVYRIRKSIVAITINKYDGGKPRQSKISVLPDSHY